MENMAQDYADSLAETLRGIRDDMEAVAEYVTDALDYRLTYTSQRELIAVELLVTFGGPNAWVTFEGDTATVSVTWGGDRGAAYVVAPDAVDMVQGYFEGMVTVV